MIKIAFTGDIAFSKYFKDSYSDPNLISPELAEFLNSSDYVVPNVEGALTGGNMKRGDSSTPAHASDPRAIYQLLKIKGNIWNLSNNHTLDCGKEGLDDTIKLANENGCRILGAGNTEKEAEKPVIIKEAGGIGLIAVCYKKLFQAKKDVPGVVFWKDDRRIKKMIKNVKKNNRWCVLIAHSGEEFSNLPMPFLRKQYLKFLKYGADIIVGHHPHVPQNYEKVRDKIIFYSLGNFIFDTDYQRIQNHTDKGVLLKLSFDKKSYRFSTMSYKIDRDQKRVYPTQTPAIFCDINDKDYKTLAPLAVRRFLQDYKRAKIFLRPKMANYTRLQWVKWYIKNKGILPSISLWFQNSKHKKGKWKTANPNLLNYINGKID